MVGCARILSRWRGWLAASGCGLVVGWILGLAVNASHFHAGWMAAAGVLVGVGGAWAARSHPVIVALWGGVITALVCVLTITFQLWRNGRWPLPDQNMDMIEHYGTTGQALLRITVILLAVVCVPCVVAAALTAFAKSHARPERPQGR